MSKYEVLPEQLLHEGTLKPENIFHPDQIEAARVLRVHTEEYFRKLRTLTLSPAEIRRTGFPLNNEVVDRELFIMNGTLQCARYALSQGVAMNIAGGTHHAFSNRGAGFCLLNDIAIASKFLLDEDLATKILVVDLDVHQGNGTHAIFAGDADVYTFSMHGGKNYPFHKVAGTLDVELADGTGDDVYLAALHESLPRVLAAASPDLVVYIARADPFEGDRLGRLALTIDGLARRDAFVLDSCREVGIPVAITIGGGYGRHIEDTVAVHARTVRIAASRAAR
jgi:acetoin utilization deacetylase AcuC-like enzyme